MAEVDYDSLSDDEFLNQFDSITETSDESTDENDVVETNDESDDVPEVDEELAGLEDEAGADDISDAEEDDSDDTPEDDDSAEKPEEAELNEEDSARLLASFEVNGQEISVRNIDEARQLMKLGAAHQKRMNALRPDLKTLKLLQNHNLLEPAKVSLMIDASKGNKAALAQLIKESGIDPLDLDVEAADSYKPTQYEVDEKEMVFDEVLERIRDTATYKQTINLVGNVWDAESKKIVADNPELLEVLNTQIGNGIYELIRKEVDHARLLGRLNGVPDIVAYKQIGDDLNSKGAFAKIIAAKTAPTVRKVVTKKPVTTSVNVQAKKRAAAPARKHPNKTSETLEDLANMSDEKFLRLFNQ